MENDSGVSQEPQKLTGRERQLAALSEHRAATQFGGERANPQAQDIPDGNKPWSVKGSIRYLSHIELDQEDIDLDEMGFVKKLIRTKFTAPQMQAARALAKGMCGDLAAIGFTTDQIDGKVANINVNAEAKTILEMNDEQLDQYIATNLAKAGCEPGSDGEKPAGGSEAPTS